MATRPRAHADAIDDLATEVPGAYREQVPLSLAELLPTARHIGERQQDLLHMAAVLAEAPLANTAQRAGARALADARLGEAIAALSRAAAMAARLHEADGLTGTAVEGRRERASTALNLALSRTRLFLTDASQHLRAQACGPDPTQIADGLFGPEPQALRDITSKAAGAIAYAQVRSAALQMPPTAPGPAAAAARGGAVTSARPARAFAATPVPGRSR
ncbi:hypothetical protein [Kitasatospora sp. NE20-6]|uniref:hypothetical protein n=1 Tax=Kitasatospora sp. NE20-6 TaxID=2859066 RepID=UPI0038B385B3